MNQKLSIITVLLFAVCLITCKQSVDTPKGETDTANQTDVAAAMKMLQKQSAGKKFEIGKDKLSEYGFFVGNLADLKPAADVIPYELNTPLFSDYAHKLRFFKVPEGTSATYSEKDVLEFPVGTYIIKNFYYHNDERDHAKGRQIMETRLLLHQEDGWKPLPTYVWNAEQTEAVMTVEGATIDANWIDESGKTMNLAYSAPSQSLCKSCHVKDGKLTPIGPKARQLNRNAVFASNEVNQLTHYASLGVLTGLPELSEVYKTPVWDEPSSGTLHKRALAYLDMNCAHCHSKGGPGNTSALHLTEFETNEFNLGINKHPIAAGKGTGGRPYDIVKGAPEKSILLYRMEATSPGEMMPEVARKLVHQEGVDLIREWITKM